MKRLQACLYILLVSDDMLVKFSFYHIQVISIFGCSELKSIIDHQYVQVDSVYRNSAILAHSLDISETVPIELSYLKQILAYRVQGVTHIFAATMFHEDKYKINEEENLPVTSFEYRRRKGHRILRC